jgi:hypothetical protein
MRRSQAQRAAFDAATVDRSGLCDAIEFSSNEKRFVLPVATSPSSGLDHWPVYWSFVQHAERRGNARVPPKAQRAALTKVSMIVEEVKVIVYFLPVQLFKRGELIEDHVCEPLARSSVDLLPA